MSFEEFQGLLSSDRIELLSSSQYTSDKFQLLKYLLKRCIQNTPMKSEYNDIWQSLEDRENSMSTGIGLGIAIPHCSSVYVSHTTLYMAVLEEGIGFQSIDEVVVRMVMLILFPKEKFERHVKLLATVARVLNDPKVRENILNAKTPAQVKGAMCAASTDSKAF